MARVLRDEQSLAGRSRRVRREGFALRDVLWIEAVLNGLGYHETV